MFSQERQLQLFEGDPLELSDKDKAHVAEIQESLHRVRDFVSEVAKGLSPGLVVWGRAGVSKSHTVREELERCGADYRWLNSMLTGRGLFKALESQPDAIFVLDDVEAMFRDRAALGVLRSLLDGPRDEQGVQQRHVTWSTNDGQDAFDFKGGLIVLLNRQPSDSPELRAIVSRVPCIGLNPSDRQVLAQMRRIANEGFRQGNDELDPEQAREVCEFIADQARLRERRLDLRMLFGGFADYLHWSAGDARSDWRELVLSRLCGQAAETRGEASKRPMPMDDQLSLARQIYEETAGFRSREARWAAVTGLSGATFRRRISKLLESGALKFSRSQQAA